MRKFNPSEPKVSANAVPSARNARPNDKAPGARAAKHSKAVVEEPSTAPSGAAPAVALQPTVATPVVPAPVVKAPVVEVPVVAVAPKTKTVTSEEIAKLAYCYWADRGYQGGNPEEDWARAKQALLE